MRSKYKVTKWVRLHIDSHPFSSRSIAHSTPGIQIFQNLTFKIQGHRSVHLVGPTSYWLTFLLFYFNPWNKVSQNLTLKFQGRAHWRGHSSKHVPLPTDSHPFRSMSIGLPIPVIQLFKICPWKSKVKIINLWWSRQFHRTLNRVNLSSGFRDDVFHNVWTPLVLDLTRLPDARCQMPHTIPQNFKWRKPVQRF